MICHRRSTYLCINESILICQKGSEIDSDTISLSILVIVIFAMHLIVKFTLTALHCNSHEW